VTMGRLKKGERVRELEERFDGRPPVEGKDGRDRLLDLLFEEHGLNGRADIAAETALEFAKIDLPFYNK